VNVFELRIHGVDRLSALAAARGELFAFREVYDLVRLPGPDRFAVVYDGEAADAGAWCRTLTDQGFPAEPIGPIETTFEAA
jgi:hypothetical protein